MFTTTLSRPRLESEAFAVWWREAAAAAGASFFQDWTWVGCLARTRFPEPVLAEVHDRDGLAALALFNRTQDGWWGETLWLQESGDPAWDAVFTEHNGALMIRADPAERDAIAASLLRALASARRRVVLSGVGPAWLAAAQAGTGATFVRSARPAPYVDLRALPAAGFAESLSRNTRHQLRRSNRRYSERGPLVVRRAGTVGEASAYFDRLVSLHETTWAARGKPGAFSTPELRRFHAALLAEGVPRGEVDLLEIAAGSEPVGYLMNFNHRGVVSAYQSGFCYPTDDPHAKPGLTCHALAIERAQEAGAQIYDFLAGEGRYKSSLSNAERTLYWLESVGALHPALVGHRAREVARAMRRFGRPKMNF